MQISEQAFTSQYDQAEAGADLANLFRIEPTDLLLRRRYDSTDRVTGFLLSSSVSYMPLALVSSNPALLDEANEPWPGGTQHQLSTVGIEIMTMIDEVTARMPTTAEAQLWGLSDGVPPILCRRISLDADEKVVEVSDAEYPADRTELRFVTPLKPWPKRRSNGGKPSGRQGARR
ncbi:UTRA domain-containing protein [Micromonospora sp. NPDC005171]|uniref:UTRA domain-containing protein n=1 Tax=Micromonospora sp. NPDC005171 TaxID=3156866 RepID=UPI0033A72FD7